MTEFLEFLLYFVRAFAILGVVLVGVVIVTFWGVVGISILERLFRK